MNITPMQMLIAELGGLYGSAVLRDIGRTIELYDFYDGKGQDWNTPAGLDYKPTKKRVNLVKKLIKREAGFMFGRTPELTLTSEAAASGALDEAQTTLDGQFMADTEKGFEIFLGNMYMTGGGFDENFAHDFVLLYFNIFRRLMRFFASYGMPPGNTRSGTGRGERSVSVIPAIHYMPNSC